MKNLVHSGDPTQEDLARVLLRVRDKVLRYLETKGYLQGESHVEEAEGSALWARLCAGSVEGRIAQGPKAGWRIVRLQGAPVVVPPRPDWLCADLDGFNLHAGVSVEAGDREGLERVSRYILRPALAQGRLREQADGRLLWELKRPYADGTTHLVFEPLELIERLCALVPPPRAHQLVYHGLC